MVEFFIKKKNVPAPGLEPGTLRFRLTIFHSLLVQGRIASTAERSSQIELNRAD